MSPKASPRTVGELRKSRYRPMSVRAEMRKNLIRKIEADEELFPGIIGFEKTVVPQIENAILAGQAIILLGERGQAKSRLIRQLVSLLDESIPAVAGCDLNDDPYDPICRRCKDLAAELGDDVPVEWLSRERRYSEKLATPDISVADLIGEVDPVKVAEGRYLSDELTIHYGLIPRANRGIFAINELPDLSERIQVAMLNLMEERDVQIRGYRIMLPVDVFIVASANPEDYTSRGRIITPLKDRYGAQIRTHYPTTREHEIEIFEQESTSFPDTSKRVTVPQYMKEVVAEITWLARRSPDISQRSGVSLRVSISNYETLQGSAFKRGIRLREQASPRISDLPSVLASTVGKVEMEGVEEDREAKVVGGLIKKAVLNVFCRYFDAAEFDRVVECFDDGLVVETGPSTPSQEYVKLLPQVADLEGLIRRVEPSKEPAAVASAVEFALEGLHLNRRLNRDAMDGGYVYRT